jgi:hypothetical protein
MRKPCQLYTMPTWHSPQTTPHNAPLRSRLVSYLYHYNNPAPERTRNGKITPLRHTSSTKERAHNKLHFPPSVPNMPKERPTTKPLVSYLYHYNNPAPERTRNGKMPAARHSSSLEEGACNKLRPFSQPTSWRHSVCQRLHKCNPNDTLTNPPKTFRRAALNYRVKNERSSCPKSWLYGLAWFSLSSCRATRREERRREIQENCYFV